MQKHKKAMYWLVRKIILSTIICGVVFVLMALPATADTVASGTCGENLTWELDNTGTLTISGIGEMTSHPWRNQYAISNSIKRAVIQEGATNIYEGAFYNCVSLVSVSIPNTVTSIGRSAFSGCTYLTDVILPEGVVSIGERAFCECKSLTNMIIPSEVTSIEDYTFFECKWMTSITLPDGLISIGRDAFFGCGIKNIVLPDSLNSIGDGAFSESRITNITIPDGITIIDGATFADCNSLISVSLPRGLREIRYSAFYGCFRLPNIIIPDGVVSIDRDAFTDCENLTSITIPSSVTNITGEIFEGCKSLQNIVIPACNSYAYNWAKNKGYKTAVQEHGQTIIDERVDASCTESGLTQGAHCVDCGEVLVAQEVIPATGHTEEMDAEIPATCTETGLSAGSHCSVCGVVLAEQEIIPALGHDWHTAEYTWSPDHTTITAIHTCERNEEHIETETVNVTAEETLPATCTEMGQTTYTSDVFTNEAFSVQTKALTNIDAIGHQWGEPAYTWAEDSLTVTATRVCEHDETHIETETVSVTAEVTKPATCSEMGETTYISDAFINEAFSIQMRALTDIDTVAHTVVIDPAVSPSDCRPGLTEGSHCSVCGEVLIAQERVHPLVWDIEETDGEITIQRYYGNEMNVSIPSQLEELPVREIAAGAFPYDNCPERVYIPSGIRFISNTSFDRNVIVYCHEYSEADYWADEADYTAIYVDNTVSGTFYRITMPADFTMEYGESRKLEATVWPLTGSETVTISSSNDDVVAVNEDWLTALAVGQATVTLTVGGTSANVEVTIHADPMDFVIADDRGKSNDPFYVITKKNMPLFVNGILPSGAEISSVTWTSADESIAIINDTGVVTAKRPGQVEITATTQNGLTRSCEIIVCYPVEEITFEQSEYLLALGESVQVKALAVTAGGSYTNLLLRLTSSDETVALIDQQGFVITRQPGTVTITATAENDVTATCTLIVKPFENVLTLPAFLTEIGNEAFADLPNVNAVRIPSSVTSIAEDAFSGSNVVILTPKDSWAEQWAEVHGLTVFTETAN